MQIKVFRAASMKEAMEQVKDTLGRDAVILHTKKYREGGFLGYRSKEVVEVTAALEEEEKVKKKPAAKVKKEKEKKEEAAPLPAAMPVMPASVLAQYKTNGTEQGIELAEKKQVPLAPPVMKAPSFPNFSVPPPPHPPVEEEKLKALKPRVIKAENFQNTGSSSSQAAPVMPAQPTEPAKGMTTEPPPVDDSVSRQQEEDAIKIRKLEDELAQMKILMARVMGKKGLDEETVSLQEALFQQEVEEDILQDMAAKSGAGETLADRSTAEARETLSKYLEQKVKFSEGIRLNRHGVRIAALIGATGVGKTTTLAKIAAKFVLEKGVKAALITADTYRISAVEQLKTYSDIIGLPLEIVYTPQELRRAIIKHKDKALILIDTAGRSQHNEYQMKELVEFLEVDAHMEKHLVLSATTKNRDAADILEKFSVCKPDHIIFTKTDETGSLGLILNLLRDKKMALSYFTNGQSVPDDIVPASPSALAEMLLRD